MSYSMVRTCASCGSRSELDIDTVAKIEMAISVLVTHFVFPGGGDGCPDCLPEVFAAANFDDVEWRASVERARSRLPK